MLSLDTEDKYFIRTCGEEPHYAYNRVGLTGEYDRPLSWLIIKADMQSTSNIGMWRSCT